MAKITKTICDKCNKEIDYKDWYYSVNITYESNSCDVGQQLTNGDYCKECFREIIKNL